jgi:hypothetical protein
MSGERSKGEEGSKQSPIGKGPLENDLWSLIEEVEKNKGERSLMLNEEFNLLKEKDNQVDEK